MPAPQSKPNLSNEKGNFLAFVFFVFLFEVRTIQMLALAMFVKTFGLYKRV